MSVQVQLRRDTLANVLANHGALGEVFISTDTHGLFIQDGATKGGFTPNGTSPARAATAIDASSVPHGGNISFGCQEELLTALSGATKISTITFPNPCLVLGVSMRVTTTITGTATSFEIGRTGGAASEFGSLLGLTAGTTNSGILGTPNGQYSSVTVTLTAVGGTFTAGAVRIQLNYILLNPPTS